MGTGGTTDDNVHLRFWPSKNSADPVNRTQTMKLLVSAVSLLAVASVSDALSLYNPAKAKALSQKSEMQQTMGTMGMTRRETIQMPSTSPMVPYMVRSYKASYVSE